MQHVALVRTLLFDVLPYAHFQDKHIRKLI